MLLLFHSCLFRCFCVVALAAFHRCSLSLLPVSFSHKSLHASHLYFIMSWWTKMASTLRCLMETRSLNSLKSTHTHTRMHRVWWESILGGEFMEHLFLVQDKTLYWTQNQRRWCRVPAAVSETQQKDSFIMVFKAGCLWPAVKRWLIINHLLPISYQ